MGLKLFNKTEKFNLTSYYKHNYKKNRVLECTGTSTYMFGQFLLDYIYEDWDFTLFSNNLMFDLQEIMFKSIVASYEKSEDENDYVYLITSLNHFFEKLEMIKDLKLTLPYDTKNKTCVSQTFDLMKVKPYLYIVYTELLTIKDNYIKISKLTTHKDNQKNIASDTFQRLYTTFNNYDALKKVYLIAIDICFNKENQNFKEVAFKDRFNYYLTNIHPNIFNFNNSHSILEYNTDASHEENMTDLNENKKDYIQLAYSDSSDTKISDNLFDVMGFEHKKYIKNHNLPICDKADIGYINTDLLLNNLDSVIFDNSATNKSNDVITNREYKTLNILEFDSINSLCFYEFSKLIELQKHVRISMCTQCNKMFVLDYPTAQTCLNVFSKDGKICRFDAKHKKQKDKETTNISSAVLLKLKAKLYRRFNSTYSSTYNRAAYPFLDEYIKILVSTTDIYNNNRTKYQESFEKLLDTLDIKSNQYRDNNLHTKVLELYSKFNNIE